MLSLGQSNETGIKTRRVCGNKPGRGGQLLDVIYANGPTRPSGACCEVGAPGEGAITCKRASGRVDGQTGECSQRKQMRDDNDTEGFSIAAN